MSSMRSLLGIHVCLSEGRCGAQHVARDGYVPLAVIGGGIAGNFRGGETAKSPSIPLNALPKPSVSLGVRARSMAVCGLHWPRCGKENDKQAGARAPAIVFEPALST